MKMRRGVLVACLLGVVLLAGCIGISLLGVSQPATWEINKPFTVKVTAEIDTVPDSGDGADDNASPVVAVNLPDCFKLANCQASINGNTYDCEPPSGLEDWIYDIIQLLFGDEGTWEIRNLSGFPGSESETLPYQVTYDLSVVSECLGSFDLDYGVWLSGGSGDVEVTSDFKIGVPIKITPVQVPVLSGFSALIFAGLLFIASLAFILFKRRTSGNQFTSISLILLAAVLSGLILGGVTTALADGPVKMDLTVENVWKLVTSLSQGDPTPPRDLIKANFILSAQQEEFLDALSTEDLDQMYETINNANDVDDVRCMFVKGNPPRAACVIK